MENKNTISQADIDNMISKSQVKVQTVFGKCTIMSVQLPNGFVIVESSACVDPINYNEAMGASICMNKIKATKKVAILFIANPAHYQASRNSCQGYRNHSKCLMD